MFQNALNRHLVLRIFYQWRFLLSCFTFIFQPIDYQDFWRLKHTTFMFHFYFQCFIQKNTEGEKQKHCGSDLKTLWERFKNTEGAIQKHWGSDNALPQRFEKWNMKLKMKHPSLMFHFPKWLIFNCFITKYETWKVKQKFWKRIEIFITIHHTIGSKSRQQM